MDGCTDSHASYDHHLNPRDTLHVVDKHVSHAPLCFCLSCFPSCGEIVLHTEHSFVNNLGFVCLSQKVFLLSLALTELSHFIY